jgi:CHAT domain-containing protein/thioredoxin-like negative regulator of GroEL
MRIDKSTQHCLTDDDFYSYIAQAGGGDRRISIEAHLVSCSRCRDGLADLLRMLHPEAGSTADEISEPTAAELDELNSLVRQVAQREGMRAGRVRSWQRWMLASAAALAALAISLWSFKYFYEKIKSEAFYAQAKTILEESYAGKSPSNLRLALPFGSAASNRGLTDNDSFRRAENLLSQALAFRDGMVEAHLGIAFIYLSESQFGRARDEFQKALDTGKGGTQALLGRGVAQYEESFQTPDPIRRSTLLAGALADFDAVLGLNSDSAEARYDKAWTLYECGRHKEALQEIEECLARDSGSVWAEELRHLRVKIGATKSSAVDDEVNRAARSRDKAALDELGRQAPYMMPAAIRSALRRSLAANSASAAAKDPKSTDLSWAAQILEAAYASATGDHSFNALLKFYEGLSPGQLALKKNLDQRLQDLVKLHRSGNLTAAMNGSKSLESEYTNLQDFWQVANIHHLCGNTLYFSSADYEAARIEYGKMLEIAERLHSPDITAKALASLALINAEQRKFDDGLRCAEELRTKARVHRLDSWQAYSELILGDLFRRLGWLDQSLREYTAALRIAYPLQDEGILIDSLENSGIVLDRLGRLQDARSSYQEALEQQNRFLQGKTAQPAPAIVVRRLNLVYKQGDLALRMGDLAAAESFFKEALTSVPGGMRELEARNRLGMAQVYLNEKRIPEAESMLASIDASGQYPEINWQARFLRGALLEETGDHAGALASLRQATQVLEQMRQNIKSGDLRQSFLTDRYDPYRAIVAILCQSFNDSRGALEYVDRAKSITLKEQLKLQDPAPGAASKLILPENEVAQSLRSAAVLEYFFIKDKLLIFMESQGRLHAVSQKITAQELDRQVREYSRSITGNDLPAFMTLSRQLFAELIAPIQSDLMAAKPDTLMILPDGPLHLLPFAGLQDERGQFLIERASIAVAPSRSVLRHCLDLGQGRNSANPSILLIDGSANLTNARDELAFLLRLYGSDARLLSPEGERAGGQAVASSEIIHFAGHSAILQGKPVLMLKGPPAELYLDSAAITAWQLPRARLVYLAGCSTGIGPLREGESPWGLVPAFLKAGAPAIITSLLPVDDASTRVLTSRFYELLRGNATNAGALQKAQLALLAAARSTGNLKPQTWVPYILVGNPR